MPHANHDIATVSGQVLHETDRAYLFTNGETLKTAGHLPSLVPKGVWLPKSQCEWCAGSKEMQIPEWLALEKGLI